MTTTTATPSTQTQWKDANRFLNSLLNNPNLTNSYLQICQQANGQENADQILDNWLEQQGYNTIPEMIYTALVAWQNTSLAPWTGIYGQSYFGNNQAAPVLVIGPDSNDVPIPYLNGVPLKNYTFKSVETDGVFNPTLTWNFDSNDSAGEIIFYYTSPITMSSTPPTGYTRNWFKGTLQMAKNASSQSYYGGLSQINNASDIPQAMNLSAGDDIANFFTELWQNYKLYICIVSGVVGCIIIGSLIYYFRNRQRVPERNVEEVNREVNEIQNNWNLVDQQGNEEQTILYRNNEGILSNHSTEQILSEREQAWRYKYGTEIKMIQPEFLSQITGIPEQTIKASFRTMDNNPEMIKTWNELTDEAVAKKYVDQDFKPVNPNDPEYKQWLEKVKTQLKEAQYPESSSSVSSQLEKSTIQDLEDAEQLIQSQEIDPNDPEYQEINKAIEAKKQKTEQDLQEIQKIVNQDHYTPDDEIRVNELINKHNHTVVETVNNRPNIKIIGNDLMDTLNQPQYQELKQQLEAAQKQLKQEWQQTEKWQQWNKEQQEKAEISAKQYIEGKEGGQLMVSQLIELDDFNQPPANLKPVEKESSQVNHSQPEKPQRPDIKDSQQPGMFKPDSSSPIIQPSDQSKPMTDQNINQIKQGSSDLDPAKNNDSNDKDIDKKQDPKKEVTKPERPQEFI